MTKILYIVTLSELGGSQRYIADLASNLPREQYEIAVAAGGNGPLFDQLAARGITAYRLNHLVRAINPVQDAAAFFEVKKLIKKIKPDVVHLNSSKAGVIGSIAAKLTGVKKVVYTAHGFVFNEPMAKWKKMLYLTAERFTSQYKDTIICVSEFDRRVGLSYRIAPAHTLVTIRNGIPEPAFLSRADARRAVGLADDATIIGTVGNFYPTKDLIGLVRAAKIVQGHLPDALFAIIGDGVERGRIEAEIKRLDLEKTVTLCGQRDRFGRYFSNHFKLFDVYVCSSVKEGLPFSILEAMAAGLPIVSTNVGGIPEIITDNSTGLLVEQKNPQALADAIVRLLHDKKLAERLAHQAQQEVRAKFSLERMIEETKKVYQSGL